MAILLDMDGVLFDFNSAVCRLFDRDPDEVFKNWPEDCYDIAVALGLGTPKDGWGDQKKLWSKIDSQGMDFWAELEPYPWAKDLYEGCTKIDETYFLTSPSRLPECAAGKLKCIQEFVGTDDFRNFLIGPPKYLCAQPNHILIDDYPKNTIEFESHGGCAILFPRLWNNSTFKRIENVHCNFGKPVEKKVAELICKLCS